MADFCNSVLINAVLCTVLGCGVFAVTPLLRRLKLTAVVHMLWVLVLLRMLAPPMLLVDVTPARDWAVASVHRQRDQQQQVAKTVALDVVRIVKVVAGVAHDYRMLPRPDLLAEQGKIAVAKVKANVKRASTNWQQVEGTISRVGVAVPRILFPIWCIGAIYILVTQLYGAFAFRRFAQQNGYSSRVWQRRVDRVAKRMGMKRCPEIRLVRATMSPMLWGFGRRTQILFPERLLLSLSVRAQDTLLAHELAHFRRGDQWVRIVELLATAAFWWHPVLWWARREIEQAEEECCDAWAVRHANGCPRTYAEALLATVDFISVPQLPPVASGAGSRSFLRQRIRAIMCHRLVRGKTLLPDSYPSLAVFAMVVLLPFPAITSNSPQPKAVGTMARAIDTSGSTNSTAAVPSEKSDGQTEYRPSNARLAIDEVNRAILKPRSGQWADLGIGRVSAAQFSGNGELLAVGTFNGRLEVYDTEQAVRRHEFEAGNSKVNSIAFSPDDQMLVVGTRDGTCRLIDLCQDQKDVVRRRRGSSVTCVRFSRCGRFASVVWQRRSRQLVEFWDLLSSRVTSTPSTDLGIVAALDLSEDSSDVPNWQFVLTDGTFCHCDASTNGIVFAKSSRPKLTSAKLEQLRLPTSSFSSLR